MRIAGALLLSAAAAIAPATSASADGGVQLQVSTPWQATTGGPGWMPFLFTVTNGSNSTFEGTVALTEPAGFGTGDPVYQQPLTVAAQTQKRLLIYAAPPSSASTYEAQLDTSGGSTIASAQVSISNGRWVGVLSDSTATANAIQVGQIDSVRGSLLSAYEFTGADGLPPSSAYLKALGALVIDGFDTASLTQSQLRVISDYVGGGGSLVIATGADWRRTVAGLPAGLQPLRPDHTASASLDPLMSLVGATTDVTTTIAAGGLGPGARAAVTATTGEPLIAEESFGAGRVVELAFDPDADSVASDVRMQAWGQALSRAISSGTAATGCIKCFMPAFGAAGGMMLPVYRSQGGVPWQPYASAIQQVLLTTGQLALPPAGLLVLLLLLYVGVAGPINYVLLGRLGRRELAWLTLPLMAVVIAGATYGFGIGRAGSVFDNQLQVAVVLPDGRADVIAMHGVFVPRRGDYQIQLAPGELAAGLGAGFVSTGTTPETVSIQAGTAPVVRLSGAPVWSETSLRTEAVESMPAAAAADLYYRGGGIFGTVRNTGTVALKSIELWLPDGRQVALGSLGPGSTMRVSAYPPSSGGFTGYQGGAVYYGSGSSGGAQLTADQKLAFVQSLAPSLVDSSGPLLVAGFDGERGLQVDGTQSDGSTVAVLAEPVAWRSVDAPPVNWLSARLVASSGGAGAGSRVDVYEFDVPPGLSSTLQLSVGGYVGGPVPVPQIVPGPAVCVNGSCSCPANVACAGGSFSSGAAVGPVQAPPAPTQTTFEVFDPAAGRWETVTSGARLPASDADGGRLLIRVTGPYSYNVTPQLQAVSG